MSPAPYAFPDRRPSELREGRVPPELELVKGSLGTPERLELVMRDLDRDDDLRDLADRLERHADDQGAEYLEDRSHDLYERGGW